MILQVPQGTSVREALVKHFGMDPAYLENRIQTLFLNGKPVDDMDAAVVAEGSVLALSAAMPGLVGATMRRGGYYASMRRRIETETRPLTAGDTPVRVTVKLFNLVARELGPDRFAEGILVDGSTFHAFLKDQEAMLRQGDYTITVDGSPVSISELAAMDLQEKDVLLELTRPSR